jgi:hypothetical protein
MTSGFYQPHNRRDRTNQWLVGWLVGLSVRPSVDGNQAIWENILESEKKKMTTISQRTFFQLLFVVFPLCNLFLFFFLGN